MYYQFQFQFTWLVFLSLSFILTLTFSSSSLVRLISMISILTFCWFCFVCLGLNHLVLLGLCRLSPRVLFFSISAFFRCFVLSPQSIFSKFHFFGAILAGFNSQTEIMVLFLKFDAYIIEYSVPWPSLYFSKLRT